MIAGIVASSMASAAPPADSDPHWSKVVLMIGADGVDGSTAILDESAYAAPITIHGAAQIDTADPAYGTGSLILANPNVDLISLADGEQYWYGAQDFTIEITWQPLASGNHYMMGQGTAGGFAWWGLAVESSSFRWYDRDNVQVFENTGAFTPVLNQKYKLCVERNGSTLRLYRDGVMVKKVTNFTAPLTNATDPVRVGQIWPGVATNSRVDEIRITKGVARYNSDAGYTPSLVKFPRSGPPAFLVGPTISGNTFVGETLTCAATHTGVDSEFEWRRDGVAISGQTASTYLLVMADVGTTITCEMTISNATDEISAVSNGLVITLTQEGYRYYFLEVVTTGNSYIGCSTIKLLDGGGTDHALQANGGLASAVGYSVNLPTYPVTLVNDGNDSSFTTSAANSAGSGRGILIDLGDVQAIAKLGFRSRSDGFGAAEAITTGFIKAKVNLGDAYTTLYTVNESGWSSNQYREFVL